MECICRCTGCFFGAGLQGLLDTRKSILSWMDGTAWLVQSRIVACVREFACKHEYEAKPPKEPNRKDPLEELGHIPIREGNRWSCSLCGHTWTAASGAKIVGHGICPGPKLWRQEPILGKQVWATKQGSHLVIGGLQIHGSHT